MDLPPDDHECGWKTLALELLEKISVLEEKLEALQRHVFGKKSEKMPPMDREVGKRRPAGPEAAAARRQANAKLKATRLQTEDVHHKVPDEQRICPHCHRRDLQPVGKGKESFILDYVPGYFRRKRHVRETLACPCGAYIVTAPGPDTSVEGTRYGDGLRAHVVVSKCADSIPIYRQAKALSRLGIPIARSTLTELFHQTAHALSPLVNRLVELVALADVVQADETPMKMQYPDKRGYIWTFIADNLVVYRFSAGRSGATPSEVLGGSTGTLVVDMYTGYNEVTSTGGRTRAACLAHARRKYFDALSYAPGAQAVLDMIRDVYVVERDAHDQGIVATPAHRELRQARSRPIMDKLHAWLLEHQVQAPPKSPLGQAIAYTLNNWTELTRFLDDERLPPDNNRSERALRVVALGRKNYLFVGDEDSGKNVAGLYSLVATCEANDVDPLAYLTDVLGRIGSHPAAQIDELLPQNWNPTNADSPT